MIIVIPITVTIITIIMIIIVTIVIIIIIIIIVIIHITEVCPQRCSKRRTTSPNGQRRKRSLVTSGGPRKKS